MSSIEELNTSLQNYLRSLETEMHSEQSINTFLKNTIIKNLKNPSIIKELTKKTNPIIKTICENLKNKKLKKNFQIFLKFCVRFYEEIGYNIFFDFNEYFRTFEKIYIQDPKFLNKKFLKEIDKSILDNPLLNIDLMNFCVSLFFHINKKQKFENQKNFILILLSIISIHSYEKKIQKSLRSHKFAKSLIENIKRILDKKNILQIDLDILNLSLEIISKISYKNQNNQDYLFKKGFPKLFNKFQMLDNKKNFMKIRGFFFYLINSCDMNDFQLYLWSSNFLNDILNLILKEIDNFEQNDTIDKCQILQKLQCFLKLICSASNNCEEIILDFVQKKKFILKLWNFYLFLKNIKETRKYYYLFFRLKILILDFFTNFLVFKIEKNENLNFIENNLKNEIDYLINFTSENKYLESYFLKLSLKILNFQQTNLFPKNFSKLLDKINYFFLYKKTVKQSFIYLTTITYIKENYEEDNLLKISIFIMKILNGYFYNEKIIALCFKLLNNIINNEIVSQTLINEKILLMIFNKLNYFSKNEIFDNDYIFSLFSILSFSLSSPVNFEIFYQIFNEEQQKKFLETIFLFLKSKKFLLQNLKLIAIILSNHKIFEQIVLEDERIKELLKGIIENEGNLQNKELCEIIQFLPLEYILI